MAKRVRPDTMRLCSIVLLAAVAILLSGGSTSAAKLATIDDPAAVRSLADHQTDIPPKRLLRSYVEDDERTGAYNKIMEAAKARMAKLRDNNGVAKVLKKLQLGDDALNTLKGSGLRALSEKVTAFNTKNPKKKISVIEALTFRYGDDALANALVSAERIFVENRATKVTEEIQALRRSQLNMWRKEGNTVDDVFTKLKLREGGFESLTSQKLDVLEGYIKLANSQRSRQTTLLDALTDGFGGDKAVAALLPRAKQGSGTMTKADEVESALLKKWMTDDQVPESVFKMLKLDGDIDYAFTSDNLNHIAKYIDDFNEKNPSNKVSMLNILTSSYGEDKVAKEVVSAMTNPAASGIAKKLQTEQFQGWLDNGKTVDDVWKILRLREYGHVAIASRSMDVLEEYAKLFKLENGGDDYMIMALKKHFRGSARLGSVLEMATGSDIPSLAERAERLQKELFLYWMDRGIDSTSLITRLYNVPESNFGSATDVQKSIAAKFKTFYESQIHLDNPALSPRRS